MGRRWPRSVASLAVSRAVLVIGALGLVPLPAAAHGGATGPHDHTIPVAVFVGGVAVLGASLAADHWNVVDRSTADVGVVGGGLGIVASIVLLWV